MMQIMTLFTSLALLVSSAIIADIIVIVHLIWILFMLLGFILTLCGFFWSNFFDRWLFRTAHLCGIIYVSILAIVGAQIRAVCPLTILENVLRIKHDPASTYSGEFIIHYAEKLIYPDINPLIITMGTLFIAVFTVVVFIVRPPAKIRRILFR